jgi:hypothetical protein
MYFVGVAILLIVVFIILHQTMTLDEDEYGPFLGIHALGVLGVLVSLTSWVGLAILAIYYLAKFISNKIKPKGN